MELSGYLYKRANYSRVLAPLACLYYRRCMPDLVLHAGAPKTGTSFLQFLFARYAGKLFDANIIYPRGHMFDDAAAGQITSGNGVGMANYIRPGLPHAIEDKSAFINELDDQLASADGKSVLYSSEFLVFEPGDQTASIASVAKSHGYNVRVIYLVRDIDAAAFSVYCQQLKRHAETRTFGEFLIGWSPHYRSNIQKAANAFGQDALIVYNFEEHKNRLSELFFQDILNDGFVPNESSRINRSLTSKEAAFVRKMNAPYPGDARRAAFVSDALMGLDVDAEPFAVTYEEAEYLKQRFGASVDYVNRCVRGEPTVIARRMTEKRQSETFTSFEQSLMEVMTKLVLAI